MPKYRLTFEVEADSPEAAIAIPSDEIGCVSIEEIPSCLCKYCKKKSVKAEGEICVLCTDYLDEQASNGI